MSTANSPSESSNNVGLAEVLLRLTALEREVEQLKSGSKDKSRWLDRIEGSMKDDPDFAEIARLGQEYRKAYFTD